jgi:ankyrin repeat/IBR domain-containing protein 1
MGSSSSKFKKYLQHGDEYAAMQVYQSSPELRRGLEPNYSYGDHHAHNTPLHYASRHGMKHLIRAFLNDLDGDPNRRNAFGQTSLHCVCNVSRQKSPNALERRAYSVILLLSWRGPVRPSTGERERVEVNARDDFGYTALHYGAQSGLRKCIEYLLAHGADPFAETRNSKQ